MNGGIKGRRALITGASSGIGADMARRLAEEGANLVLVARREDRLEALADELIAAHGVEVDVLPADLTRPDAPRLLHDRTEAAGKPIDLLINNAGFGDYAPFLDVGWERYADLLRVNAVALTELTRRFLPDMVSRGRGQVVNVASTGAFMPVPDFAVYAATKAYVLSFSEAVDEELRGTGVRVQCVCPGGTHTGFLEVAGQKTKPSGERFMMSSRKCADLAIDGVLRGKRTIVTGWLNWLTTWAARWIPRAWAPRLARVSMAQAVERTR